MKIHRLTWLVIFAVLFTGACGSPSGDDDDAAGETDDDAAADDDHSPADDDDNDDDNDNDDTEPPCDETRTPIVFVHGFLEVGDAFATQAMRFTSNGYCRDRIFAFDYNTLFGPFGTNESLDALIDAVLARTGAAKIDLLGHSLGGAVCYQYLEPAANAAKVAHYVSLASFPLGEVPNGVPGMNVSSTADTMAGPSTMPGGENVSFDDLDHLQVATSEKTFAALYPFFNGGETPATTEIVPEEIIRIGGRAVTFAENAPAPNAHIQIFKLDPETGARLTEEPAADLITDRLGYWGAFTAAPDAFYEFVCLDPSGDWPPVHYYREPFTRSNAMVYFRVFPPKQSLLGLAFRLLPLNDDYAIFAWLNINQAAVYGRDTFAVNEFDLATPEMTDPSITTITVFFFDTNFNGVSDGAPAGGIWSSFPFLRAFDLWLPATGSTRFQFDGREMNIRNWPSKTDGLSIAVFE
ncbi:MAG: alpha/beta fold hydrolase [Myxococcales bacterium]|nr:alpha/beta fold hydrolase [Myxococcales bacterium]